MASGVHLLRIFLLLLNAVLISGVLGMRYFELTLPSATDGTPRNTQLRLAVTYGVCTTGEYAAYSTGSLLGLVSSECVASWF